MAAIDDLTELVERAAVAEKVAVSSKWKERPDVEKMVGRLQKSAAEQRDHLHDFVVPDELSSRWVSLRQDYLDLGAQESLPEPATAPADLSAGEAAHVEHRLSHAAARQAERDAVAAVEFARMAL